ncbi:DUF4870 domain-containing protein [Maribacter sp. 2308TA10-17]|uniref:DUF4870 domain-containing protein n=1 Tax=Maribacter sp. 2308TA10-17 TaxID=3386276 RepID=UPI0039BCB22E
MEQSVKEEGKTMAIIAYVTVIGLIIAWFMNKDKDNAFAKFHIGQSLRIFILGIVISVAVTILVSITGLGVLSYISYIPLILIVLGIINAMNLKDEPLPVIGTIGG